MLDDKLVTEIQNAEIKAQELKWSTSSLAQDLAFATRKLERATEEFMVFRRDMLKALPDLEKEVALSLGLGKFWHWSDHPALMCLEAFRLKWSELAYS